VFIEMAELTGTIGAIGGYALRRACTDLRTLRESGHPHLSVAVNLSARQFQRQDLLAEVEAALRDTGLPAAALELEITETLAMQDTLATLETLRRIRAIGVRVSIDDFGTGHSSLAYLRRFPLDTLKVDRSFIEDVGTDPAAAAIVTAIIEMARSLGLRVVAEGVETQAQHDVLCARGCHLIQGYLLSRPLPFPALVEFLRRSAR
jgi:EAL domain-containing protein (putative c-di-GMP-specific phosphodiesterase class I)